MKNWQKSFNFFRSFVFAYLWGFPTKSELDFFIDEITHHSLVHEDVKSILDGFPSKASPNGCLIVISFFFNTFYPKSLDPNRSKEEVNGTIIRAYVKTSNFSRSLEL